jgi:putative spermidine/putrescine transport system ATP-binding protein
MSVRLTLQDIEVRLGANDVLRGVSLDVEPGEFVTLLGPSGSGKTTMLNVIAGFVRQSAGHVLFDGEHVDHVPPVRRDIGIVFQNYAIFPNMNVLDNVAFPLRARGVGRSERLQRAQRYLELVQLTDLGRRKVSTLSGGQRQRVALARALVFEPGVLLLDEPLGALDKQLRESMQLELKRIQREVGVTTISVTHDQVESLAMSDRVAIVDNGRLLQCDSPEGVYRRPGSRFVAEFLGEANIVRLDAEGVLEALDATALKAHAADATAMAAVIRPESITLVHPTAPEARMRCKVITKTFEGARYRLVVETERGVELVVAGAAGTIAGQLQPGDAVGVLYDPEDVHLVPA